MLLQILDIENWNSGWLWATMRMLEMEPRTSAIVSALNHGDTSLAHTLFCFLRQDNLLAREAQGLACLCLPKTIIAGVHHHTRFFYTDPGDWSQVLIFLLTEPSLQLSELGTVMGLLEGKERWGGSLKHFFHIPTFWEICCKSLSESDFREIRVPLCS